MPYLVLRGPFSEAYHQHPEIVLFSPETVFHAGFQQEFIMCSGAVDPPINFQVGPVIEEVKKLVPDVV
jgi:hypothetical protein